MKQIQTHGRPLTRREFISRGLVAGGATMMIPTLGNLWWREAMAEASVQLPAFLVFDCAGGAALPANFLVGQAEGPKDFLSAYTRLGWNPKVDPLDERFGLPMANQNISGILNGMLGIMSANAQKNFRMSSLLHVAEIDTSSNPLSALSLASHAGLRGKDISTPVGLRNSLSGGNSRYALENQNYMAMSVTKLDDLLNAIGLGGALNRIPDRSKETLGLLVKRLSMAQATRLLNSPADEEVLKLLGEKYDGVAAKVKATSGLDPRRDPAVAQVYGLDQDSDPDSEKVLRAAVTMGTLKGVTGPGVITISGCDYHDGTQASGDNKDQEIGLEIGRAIELAFRFQVPLFIQVITDGGIYPREGSREWQGDSVDTCMSVIGYFHPKKAPTYFQNRVQVGGYTNGQGADRSSVIGDSPLLAAYAAFANYLNVCGRINEFQILAPGIFDDQKLQTVLTLQS